MAKGNIQSEKDILNCICFIWQTNQFFDHQYQLLKLRYTSRMVPHFRFKYYYVTLFVHYHLPIFTVYINRTDKQKEVIETETRI